MPTVLSADPAGRFMVLTITDPNTIEQWRTAMTAMLEHPVYLLHRRVLIDRRQSKPLATAFVSQMTDFFAGRKGAVSGMRAAVVVSDEASFGMTRMMEMRSERENPDVTIRGFHTYDDAEQWLTEEHTRR
jgi:hypothetical protein